jgi:hypothetical protein
MDPEEMYMFREYPEEVFVGNVIDYVAVTHSGYGVNSYAVSFHLVYGPLPVVPRDVVNV